MHRQTLTYIGVLWCTLVYFGALWCTLVYFGEPRNCSPGLKIIRDGRNYYANKKNRKSCCDVDISLKAGVKCKLPDSPDDDDDDQKDIIEEEE